MNRTTLPLIGAAVALIAVTGVASLTAPSASSASGGSGPAATATRLPVQRSTLLCPQPTSSDLGNTSYTAFTPKDPQGQRGPKGTAELLPADNPPDAILGGGSGGKSSKGGGSASSSQAKPVLPLKEPGIPVTSSTQQSNAPALIGTADGSFAPGWTVQQTTTIEAGLGRGVLGTDCTAPDTDFWFPGTSTAASRQDYVHLINPDDTAAVVDLDLYDDHGHIAAPTGQELTVPPHATLPVLLSTLTDKRSTDVTLHVSARSGRVGATVQASDQKLGSDWLPASAEPATSLVLPGVPADATSVHLVAFAPGGNDADLKVRLATPSGYLTPAGHESLHITSGMTASMDLGNVTQGEAGSLVLTSQGDGGPAAPVVAALLVTRGKGSNQEMAFIPATAPIDRQATAADNRAKGSTLSLVAPGGPAQVRVTASAGSGGGTPVSKTYSIKSGTTIAITPPRPASGKGTYAVTVQRLTGGTVYGSRMLALPQGGVPMFTIQPLPDDGGTVVVPHATQDLSLLNGSRG
jgi:hypothetical protein